jgi:hypothetical protein
MLKPLVLGIHLLLLVIPIAPFAIPEQAAYTTRTITVPPSAVTAVVSNVIF